MEIRALVPSDAAAVLGIFADGITYGHATFETEPGTWDNWDARFAPTCRLIAVDKGQALGWAALSPTSKRPIYAGVGEVSLYIAEAARGQGVGKALMAALINASEEAGFWTLQAGIFPENEPSLALHKKFGFREFGRRERIGKMAMGPLKGQWRDVIYLERRSTRVSV